MDWWIVLSHRSLKENLQKLRSYSQSCLIAREEFEVDVVITVCSRLKSHCNKSIKHYATWSSTLKLSNFPNNETKFWKFSEFFLFLQNTFELTNRMQTRLSKVSQHSFSVCDSPPIIHLNNYYPNWIKTRIESNRLMLKRVKNQFLPENITDLSELAIHRATACSWLKLGWDIN